MREQRAGRERTDRHGAEHQKIIEGLNLVALVRIMTFRNQCRRADESEIPADAQNHQSDPEMPHRYAGKSDRRRRRIRTKPTPIIGRTPKRAISEPVTKLGAYMPSTCH